MLSNVRVKEEITNSSYPSFYRTRLLCTLFKKYFIVSETVFT